MASDVITQARESYTQHRWADAFRLYADADRQQPLVAEDLDRLATVAYLIGNDAESEASRTRAHQEFLGRGDREGAARCAFWLAFGLQHRGAYAPASGWLARAARLIEDSDPDVVVAGYLLVPPAIQEITRGNVLEATASLDQAASIAERFGDADLAALAGHCRGRALIYLGQIADGVALLDEVMAAVIAGDVAPMIAGDVYCSVLEGCHEVFDVRRAREWTASMTQWCASQPGLVRYRAECLIYRAEIRQSEGRWQEAMLDAREACALLEGRATSKRGAAFYRVGELQRLQGELDAAEDAFRHASHYGRSPQPGLSLLRLAHGDVVTAATAMRAILAETAGARERALVLPASAEILVAARDLEAARSASNELSAIAADFHAPLLSAGAVRAMGAVLLAENNARDALPLLRRACQAWRDLEVPYEEAETRVLIARACQEQGDTEGCALELDAARHVFRTLGATLALSSLERAHRPTPNASGLSERELQVLRLIATGKTNRSIGDDLFISEKTVARHVSNIFDKLGVSSRASATAHAYEQHLI